MVLARFRADVVLLAVCASFWSGSQVTKLAHYREQHPDGAHSLLHYSRGVEEGPPCAPCAVCPARAVIEEQEEEPCAPAAAANQEAAALHVLRSKGTGLKTGWRAASFVSARSVFKSVLPGLPKPDTPEKQGALLIAHSEAKGSTDAREAAAEAGCEEVSVVFASSKKTSCLLVVENAWPSWVMPRRRLDEEGDSFISRYEINTRFKVHEPQLQRKTAAGHTSESLLSRLLPRLGEVLKALGPVVESLGRKSKDRTVVAFAVNKGVLDILLNMVCSARAHGLAELLEDRALVFAGDDATARAVQRGSGLATFAHEAMGIFPAAASKAYGDGTFVDMMWFKTVSVFLVNRCGRDVLFMDADLIWFEDPLKDLWKYKEDTLWMDDGARSNRYAPFSANTGFYVIRHNARTRLFMFDLLTSYEIMIQWRSHQHALHAVLIEHFSRTAMSVRVLDKQTYQTGMIFHRNKTYAEDLTAGRNRPIVFHWAWTAGREEKLKFARETNTWYVAPTCTADYIANFDDFKTPKPVIAKCCTLPESYKSHSPSSGRRLR